jgi:cell shape-determining protein MreC
LKENLATALMSINDVERIQYEKEQQQLQHAALQNVRLAPFCDLKKEEESSIPFDDVGERIIVRDGKKIKQVRHHRGLDSNGEEILLYQECEMTKWEIEEMEKETEKRKLSEAEKKHIEDQIRISEEEPSIPYDYNNERIIFRDGKKYKQWFQIGFGSDIWYGEEEIS